MGLDIGSSAVKMIGLSKNGESYRVTSAAMADIADVDSDAREEINTVRAISDCIESGGTQRRLAVCSICGPEVAVRNFRFPSLPQGEIEGAARLEAGQVCPFNVAEATVDYQLISEEDKNISGILVAATDRLIKRKRNLAKGASLNCVLMDVDGLALLNCFSQHEKSPAARPTAILNIGNSVVNLAIIGHDNLPFVRDMACAGGDIVKHIVDESNISTEHVRRALSGSQEADWSLPEFDFCLERACHKLISDVAETLRYYTAQKKSSCIEKIFLCGGFALAKGIAGLLDSHLPATVELWNPFDKICCDADFRGKDVLEKNGPAMAVAAGLAMRSL